MNSRKTTRVAANRYGGLGKRVTDAVALQNDMQLVGVDIVADCTPKSLASHNVDAIRALAGVEAGSSASIATSNAALGIGTWRW